MTDHVTTEQDQGVLIVRLQRADKKNALTADMYTVMADAHSLAAKPRDALRATKRLLRRPAEPLSQRVLAEGELFSHGLESPAAKEAMSAFFEKRTPNFQQFD